MNAEEIFHQALARPPAERPAFLADACCGDEPLQRRVQALLHAHDNPGSFLTDKPPLPDLTVDDPINECPGTVIGPYKLMEQIGEGGMGLVFVAEQQQPVRRKVALKVIKPGLDTRQLVARFEAERQALALMDHPNIAKVFDGGTTDGGRPYFVMELVKGVPITEYCDQNQVPIRERLELFVSVCQAVQHAHQKGIIHRDLKPSNVLITLHDGTPVAKVIDFGVAKSVGQHLTDKTIYTQFSQMVGTPLYMSPEQADLSGPDVDTRSDIYSLGVLLYELLTGTTPFDRERLHEMGYDEMRRIIREEEPPKPSTRISTIGKAATTVSTQRQSEAKQLSRLIRGELDWIVMKSLEKDRNRRYESASTFAADVQRYLHDEPVLACPPSAWYRFGKLARRHKGPMLAVSLVVLALAAGSVGTTIGLIQAENAHQREAGLRRIAEDNEKMAKEREAETRAALDFLERYVLAAARPEGQDGGLGRDVTLRRALETALPFVDQSFSEQPLIEARLRTTLTRTFGNLGDVKLAAEQAERARTIYSRHLGPDHPDTLSSMHNLAMSYYALGRQADALKLREETLALMKAKLGPDHPTTLKAMHNLALSYDTLGRHSDALKLYEQTLALKMAKLGPDHRSTLGSMNNLALTYCALGRHDDALKLGQEALRRLKATLGPKHHLTRGVMDSVAIIYNALGRHREAVPLYEETLALMKAQLGPDDPTTLTCMHDLARTYCALGRHDEALKLGQETLAFRRAKLGAGHPDTLFSMRDVATNLIKLKRGEEAIPVIDECLRRAAERAAGPHFSGLADERLRYFEKARDATGCRTTAELWEKLNCTDPGSFYNAARYRAVTAAVLRAADPSPATSRLTNAELRQAMTWLQKAVAAGYKDAEQMKVDADLDALRDREDFRKLLTELEAGKPTMAKESKAETRAVLDFLKHDVLAARPQGREGGMGAEVKLIDAINQAQEKIGASFLDRPLVEASIRDTLGATYQCLGDYPQAIQQHERAVALREAKLGPDHPETLNSRNNLASAYWFAGRIAEVIRLLEPTLKQQEAKLGPEHLYTLRSRNNLANAYDHAGRVADAIRLHEQNLKQCEAKLGPEDPETLKSRNNLAAAYRAAGCTAEAIRLHEQNLKQREAKFGPQHPDTLQSRNNLAAAYRAAGRTAEAIRLHELDLKQREAKFGPEHPRTLHCRGNLALAYLDASRTGEAIRLLEPTLKQQEAKLGPEHPYTLESSGNLAYAYHAAGRTGEANQLDERIRKSLTESLERDLQDTTRRWQRGDWYARKGRWQQAADDYMQVLERKCCEDAQQCLHAAPTLASSDPDAYRRFRRTLFQRFGTTQDPQTAERIARACLLLPDTGADIEEACQLAERAVAQGKDNGFKLYFAFCKGLADYRRNDPRAAIATLEPLVPRFASDPHFAALNHLVLALALHRQGEVQAADQHLAEGVKLLKQRVVDFPDFNMAAYQYSHDWAIAWLLHREAQKLLTEKKVEPKK